MTQFRCGGDDNEPATLVDEPLTFISNAQDEPFSPIRAHLLAYKALAGGPSLGETEWLFEPDMWKDYHELLSHTELLKFFAAIR